MLSRACFTKCRENASCSVGPTSLAMFCFRANRGLVFFFGGGAGLSSLFFWLGLRKTPGPSPLTHHSMAEQVGLRKLLYASCTVQVALRKLLRQVGPCKLLCANCAPCKLLCASCSVQVALCKLLCVSCSAQVALGKALCANWSVQVGLRKLLCATCSAQVALRKLL